MNQKIKITDQVFANLETELANIIINKALTDEKLSKAEEVGKIVYHYASLQSFLAIIQSQSFFCTNLNYLNDEKEYKFGVEQVTKVINKLKNENFANNILNNFDSYIEKFYQSERYVTCFSKDGDILSQWRAYANHGKGVAIGFDLYNLEDSLHQHVKACQVLYNEQQQLINIEEVIKIIIEFYKKIENDYDWGDYGFEKIVRYSIIDFLHHIISTYKSEGFKEEKEFRIEYHVNGTFNKKEDEEIYFRTNDNMIIPYIILQSKYKNFQSRKNDFEMDFEHSIPEPKLPIKEIIIGPSLDFDLTKTAIEELLNKLEYKNVEIKKSNIAYRL